MLNIRSLNITNEILLLIAELDEFKGVWQALGLLAPDRLSALRRVATIESVGSSIQIEGSKLSDKEVETLFQDGNGRLSRILFFLQTLQKQKSKLQIKLEREKILVAALPEISLKIIEIAKQHGRVTVSEAPNVTGVSRNTIKDHLKSMVKQGDLNLNGAGRGSWYSIK